MNHDELINNWISMDKAAVDIGLTAEAMSAMSEEITRLRQRAEAAESALAAVPIGAMKLLVWMLDDGPWDDVALAEVQRWIDAREEAQP
jgi:hypothetical protein